MNLSLRMDKAPMGKPKGQQHLEFVKAVIAATCKVQSILPSGQIRCCLQHAGTQFGEALATSGSSSEYQLWRYLQGSCEVTQVDDKRKAGSQHADCHQRLVSQKTKKEVTMDYQEFPPVIDSASRWRMQMPGLID